jgi:hypothetical protein
MNVETVVLLVKLSEAKHHIEVKCLRTIFATANNCSKMRQEQSMKNN